MTSGEHKAWEASKINFFKKYPIISAQIFQGSIKDIIDTPLANQYIQALREHLNYSSKTHDFQILIGLKNCYNKNKKYIS